MRYSLTYAAIVTASLMKGVVAGAGANVRLCLWYDNAPAQPETITWDICGSDSHCMYCDKDAPPVTVTANKQGLNCIDIGYLESKASSSGGDTCWTDNSYWEVGFHAGNRSGQVKTKWSGSAGSYNRIYVGTSSYDTTVCGVEARCATKQVGWSGGSVGNVWLVVNPSGNNKMKMMRREEVEAFESEMEARKAVELGNFVKRREQLPATSE